MSAGARAASGVSGASATPAAGRDGPAGDAAGRLLARLTVLPALLAVALLLAGLPLLLAGAFTPVGMLVVGLPVAVVVVAAGLRWLPGRWENALGGQERTSWWALAALLVVAGGFGIFQMIYHSQQIIVMRDPASYLQFGAWIAGHGSLPIPQSRAAFGGTLHGLSFGTAAFFQIGKTIVPQFMAGMPMLLATGFWVGGAPAAVALGPVLGACAVLTFGGLTARLVGARWAPLAALMLAISLPEQFTTRSTYSEPLAQIIFLGGLCLVVDSLSARRGHRLLAALGGLALGLTILVRIDGSSDILMAVPYGALLLIARRRQAVPLLGGLVAGAVYGGVDGLVLSRPYVASLHSSIVPLALITGALVIGSSVAVLIWWDRGLPRIRGKALPNAAAALAVAVTAGFALRPYFQTVRSTRRATMNITAYYQRLDHLPVQPGREYYEISLHWVFWYIGVPAVVLATLGAALLARRCLRGQAQTWTLPLMVFAWIIVTVLYRPAITPDQPWASRRLVPGVLPGFILLAVWASAWLVRWLRGRGAGRLARAALVSGLAAVLLVPGALTTTGMRIVSGRPSFPGLAFQTTYAGEIAAVHHMCASIPRHASVVLLDQGTYRYAELLRGMCGDPTAVLARPTRSRVAVVISGIERAGRQPVLLAKKASPLRRFGAAPRQILTLNARQDEHTLINPPTGTLPLRNEVWMSTPAAPPP